MDSQGDRIAAGKATLPGLWSDSEDIPESLSHPQSTPPTHLAGDLGAKHGDVKTASVGGVIDALRAVTAPRQSPYRHVANARKGSK